MDLFLNDIQNGDILKKHLTGQKVKMSKDFDMKIDTNKWARVIMEFFNIP